MTNYAIQEQNQDLVSLLAAHFRLLYNPVFGLIDAISFTSGLPVLRAFWPMSAILNNATNRVRDFSEQNNHLDANGTGDISFGSDNFAPYARILSANSQYLSEPDGGAGGWADITGTEAYVLSPGLTIGGWFYPLSAAGSTEYMMAKKGAAGQFSYSMRRSAGGILVGEISTDGTAVVTNGGQTIAQNAWHCIIMRFTPSTELATWVNNEPNSNTTSIPASIFDSTANFHIGSQSTATNFFNGRASMCFLCASAISDAHVNMFFQMTAPLFGVSI